MQNNPVFAIRRYEKWADEFCKQGGFRRGQIHFESFPDGERGIRILEHVEGIHATLVGGTIDDQATIELFDIANGLVRYGVNTLTLVLPYFGYSTQERAVKRGDVVTAKARAVLLSAIPRARLTNEIIVFDLHTDGIAQYFEGSLHCVHVKGMQFVSDIVQEIQKSAEVVVACTDAGRAKWVEAIANNVGLPAAFVYKKRTAGSTSITGVNADVSGKTVVLYDDMVRSGSSLVNAAAAYRQAGADKVIGIASHGILPDGSVDKIRKAGVIEALHLTDSHPAAVEAGVQSPDFIKIHSCTSYLRDALIRP